MRPVRTSDCLAKDGIDVADTSPRDRGIIRNHHVVFSSAKRFYDWRHVYLAEAMQVGEKVRLHQWRVRIKKCKTGNCGKETVASQSMFQLPKFRIARVYPAVAKD